MDQFIQYTPTTSVFTYPLREEQYDYGYQFQ